VLKVREYTPAAVAAAEAGRDGASNGHWQRPVFLIIISRRGDGGAGATAPGRRLPRPAMPHDTDHSPFPPERIEIEQRSDGAIVVRVKSEGPERARLPDAVFSFRCGDPQYAYWLRRLGERPAAS